MQTDILRKKWKYLIFDSTHDNKENDYGKDYMKINFNSDDDLPLNKKFHATIIFIRSVFEDGKLYPQVF